MNYLIIGGSKSGKSKIGEEISLKLNTDKVIYIATMNPYDKEDEKRIELHIKNRENLNFVTIEKNRDLHEIVSQLNKGDTVLLDSITSLLTNEMFVGNQIIKNSSTKILKGINEIINKARNTVIVSDYIFNDSIIYDEVTEKYKKELATINRKVASLCDHVIECSFGNIKYYK